MSDTAASTTTTTPGVPAAWNVYDLEPMRPGLIEVRNIGLDPQGAKVWHARLEPGCKPVVDSAHSKEHEYLIVTAGRIEMTLDGATFEFGPGSVINIPPGTAHGYHPAPGSPTVVLIAIFNKVNGGE